MTEVSQELTSLGVQIHGGMGFIEETGASQHMRDARILTIYEGTTGIQAGDLVERKILADNGKALKALIQEMRSLGQDLDGGSRDFEVIRDGLFAAVDELERSTMWLIENAPGDRSLPGAAAVNLLMLMGTVVGGWQLARAASVAGRNLRVSDEDNAFYQAKIITARFYIEHIMPRTVAYARAATAGSESMLAIPIDLF